MSLRTKTFADRCCSRPGFRVIEASKFKSSVATGLMRVHGYWFSWVVRNADFL